MDESGKNTSILSIFLKKGWIKIKVLIIYESEEQKLNTLHQIMRIVSNTLKELQIEIEEILLNQYNIPYYSLEIQKDVKQIVEKIKEADAVVFGVKVILMAPSGVFKVFFDHLTQPAYKNMLKDKHGFCVALTDSYGERESAEYILRAWEMLGGVEGGRIPLYINDPNEIENIKEIIEKRVEDFYRIFRMPRQKLPTSDRTLYVQEEVLRLSNKVENNPPEKKVTPWMPPTVTNSTTSQEPTSFDTIEAKPVRFESFSKQQEQDIQELADFFKKQLNDTEKEISTSPPPVVQHQKTCKQMTQNLPHYFQPHLASNFTGILQFHVNGEESFEGYVTIDGGECIYSDGIHEHPDLEMNMNEPVWMDILKGKLSAQKGFMTGQLKVRGNFMILNKLDQLFKKMQ